MAAEPTTEQRETRHADIDLLSTSELVELINREDELVAPAVGAAGPTLAAAIDDIVERLRRGGRLIYAGAGSSGRLATVDAAECEPTFGLPEGRVLALIAGGVSARAAAQEAAEDDEAAGAADLEQTGVGPDDAVVALSASGSTPYALGVLKAAGAAGALTVAVTCTEDSRLAALAEHAIVSPVGPEVLAGSTRMKAGTAQKLVLNTISTVAMVRLGRTYGNLMVDVVASNTKLRARARRSVELATGAPEDEIDAALAAAGGDAKVAIVSLLTGLEASAAGERLAAADGVIRAALEQS